MAVNAVSEGQTGQKKVTFSSLSGSSDLLVFFRNMTVLLAEHQTFVLSLGDTFV